VERRFILALVLIFLVAILPGILFPPKHPPGKRAGPSATGPQPPAGSSAVAPPAPTPPPAPPPAHRAPAPGAALGRPVSPGPRAPAETVWVTSPLYRFGFSTAGGVLVSAELLHYRSFAPGDSGQPVELLPPGHPALAPRLVAGGDTIALTDWRFQASAHTLRVAGDSARLTLSAERRGARVTLEYAFAPQRYDFLVAGQVTGLGPTGAVLLVGLGDGLRSVEADSTDDFRHYAVVGRAAKTHSINFRSLDPGETKVLEGPLEWVGVKSKYFLLAALTLSENQPKFGGAIAVGEPREGRNATHCAVAATLPVPPAGEYRFHVYAGPLEYRRLARIGHDLDDANPYGGFLRPVIQPVSNLVVTVLLWMHERLSLAYGWVLIIFGVLIRVVLWPLNQRAMESSIRMQAVAPLLKSTQDKYKGDPERLQREMLKIYKEHHVNPFGGCLPMLLPMPVLFALFFVFANTIEFRGVPFLWLPDLSRADPLFILPLVMGLSMFVLSKVGQIGVPPNPQAKMMLYFMPIFMTVLFLRFAAGLNLYYAVSNLFSIPQQYRIAQRRLRQGRRT
jgi:YidC/Oxa1 family membrane protein insertase